MHVISKQRLTAYWRDHADAERPLRDWFTLMQRGTFPDFASVRATWGSADYVDGLVVFNIGGNKYRLIANIEYERGQIYILHILTHAEYNRDTWKRGS
jgi:mRNA interferase HigB